MDAQALGGHSTRYEEGEVARVHEILKYVFLGRYRPIQRDNSLLGCAARGTGAVMVTDPTAPAFAEFFADAHWERGHGQSDRALLA